MHGTIGITWEHHAHRYFKRAHGAAQLFGRPGRRRYHQEDLKWISICTRLRATGMPIRAIRRYAQLVSAGPGSTPANCGRPSA